MDQTARPKTIIFQRSWSIESSIESIFYGLKAFETEPRTSDIPGYKIPQANEKNSPTAKLHLLQKSRIEKNFINGIV